MARRRSRRHGRSSSDSRSRSRSGSRSSSRRTPAVPATTVSKIESAWSARPQRRRIPESEKVSLALLIILMIALPWAIGSAHLWTQAGIAFFAFLCLAVALIPNDLGNDPNETGTGRLFHFPVFWIGLLLLGFVAVQAFNPAYRAEGINGYAWIESLEPIAYLPAGIDAPLSQQGSFRSLLVLSIPFLAACAIWTGITRRRTAYILLWVMVLNALALAGVTLLHAYTGTSKVLWLFPAGQDERFLATFLHVPHAAAYFLTLIGPALGLAAHYYFQAKRTYERSSPSGLFAFAGIVLALILLFSRLPVAAAISAFLVLLLVYFILHREFVSNTDISRKLPFLAAGLAIMIIGAAAAYNVAEAIVDARTPAVAVTDAGNDEASPETSVPAAGWQLFREHWLYGAGTGSFPYLFSEYAGTPPSPGAHNPTRIEAGNDWVRFPAEFGVTGTLLFVIAIAMLLKQTIRRRLLENPVVAFTLASLGGTLLLAGFRVVFDNPAILTAWLGLLTLSALIIRVETTRVTPETVEEKSGLSTH